MLDTPKCAAQCAGFIWKLFTRRICVGRSHTHGMSKTSHLSLNLNHSKFSSRRCSYFWFGVIVIGCCTISNCKEHTCLCVRSMKKIKEYNQICLFTTILYTVLLSIIMHPFVPKKSLKRNNELIAAASQFNYLFHPSNCEKPPHHGRNRGTFPV